MKFTLSSDNKIDMQKGRKIGSIQRRKIKNGPSNNSYDRILKTAVEGIQNEKDDQNKLGGEGSVSPGTTLRG